MRIETDMGIRAIRWLFAATVALLMISAPATGAMYKCTDAKGSVSYQGTPCSKGTSGAKVTLEPLPTSKSLSPLDQAWVNETRPQLTSSCSSGLNEANRRRADLSLGADQIKQICECTTRRFYAENSITRLRELNTYRDSASINQLLTPILQSCAKEVMNSGGEESWLGKYLGPIVR